MKCDNNITKHPNLGDEQCPYNWPLIMNSVQVLNPLVYTSFHWSCQNVWTRRGVDPHCWMHFWCWPDITILARPGSTTLTRFHNSNQFYNSSQFWLKLMGGVCLKKRGDFWYPKYTRPQPPPSSPFKIRHSVHVPDFFTYSFFLWNLILRVWNGFYTWPNP